MRVVLCQKSAFAKSPSRSDVSWSGNQATHFLASSNGGVDTEKRSGVAFDGVGVVSAEYCTCSKEGRSMLVCCRTESAKDSETINNLPAHTGFHAYHNKTVLLSGERQLQQQYAASISSRPCVPRVCFFSCSPHVRMLEHGGSGQLNFLDTTRVALLLSVTQGNTIPNPWPRGHHPPYPTYTLVPRSSSTHACPPLPPPCQYRLHTCCCCCCCCGCVAVWRQPPVPGVRAGPPLHCEGSAGPRGVGRPGVQGTDTSTGGARPEKVPLRQGEG